MPFASRHYYTVDADLVLVFLSLLLQSIIVTDKLTTTCNPLLPETDEAQRIERITDIMTMNYINLLTYLLTYLVNHYKMVKQQCTIPKTSSSTENVR